MYATSTGAPVLPFVVTNLVEDAEHLVGVDRSQRQVIVGIAPVVEVKSAQHSSAQQPGDNLFNVLRLVVVAGVDQHQCLRPGGLGQQQRHAPVGYVGVIEVRFKRFVFDQQSLAGAHGGMRFLERLLKPIDAVPHTLRSRIVRSIRKPGRDIARIQFMCDRDAVQQMIEGLFADRRIGIAQGSEFVFLALKKVGIDRPRGHAAFAREFLHMGHVFEPVRQIPKDMEGNGRAGSR